MALVRVLQESDFGVVPPWETAPYGVVSLLAMLQFDAGFFVKAAFKLTMWEARYSMPSSANLPIPEPRVVGAEVATFALDCHQHILKGSVGKCERIAERCLGPHGPITFGEISRMLTGLRENLEDDLKGELFLHLSLAEARLYNSPTEEWSESVSKFYKTTGDIEEAAKCLALGRHTGAVFHLQRVMEFGLKTLAVKLNKPFDKNSWDSHLKDIERELEARYKAAGSRTPDEEFYSEAAAQIGHVKVAWRNPTMHIDRSYTPEVARDIWNAVKAFMRHLATKLP